jgi:lipoprotein-anchoring transpeptidase ErfK/SrfK
MPELPRIEIDLAAQRLTLLCGAEALARYPVSTGKNGPGELRDSERTPRGLHAIDEKIGAGAPMNAVFVARRPTGEVYTPALRAQYPGRDWILTRILWLTGLEPGRNRGGEVDTRGRYIYIHGAPDDVPMGVPGSRGCVRMRNADIVALFEAVPIGTPVLIAEGPVGLAAT